jgi:outer membrane receptor protein involved in Fe transport
LYLGVIPTTYRELAAFGDGTVHFTERADVTLGVRYSRDQQDYTQRTQGLFSSRTNPLAITVRSAESSEHVVTYLVNPRLHLTDDAILYGRFATGYRPGGPNLVTFDASGNPIGSPTFNADKVSTYELGAKSAFLDRTASVDFDVYYIDWSDIQLTGVHGGLAQLENGGKAAVLGAELTGSYEVHGLSIGGSLSYTDGKLKEDTPALDAKDGQRLPLSAKFSAALTADYRIPITHGVTGTVGLSERFVGNRAGGFDGSASRPQYLMGSYSLLDLRAGIVTSHFTVGIFAKNVFNKLGEISTDMSAIASNPNSPARVTLTQPRTIGLELNATFSH